ncbi:hypothetical protein [Reyranella soli]|uniref:Uncharacterized protein n=1 Tax=Reyranella soli TaxID=1230389 RepID=A0A512NKI4_9HYPH|nr:hypothetical protein [Reyranella soli]GEP59460.1 hypothetical protein RSO01_66260 [Reyranella soli]
MAKRGRKPLPHDPPSWRPIYQEVWDLIASGTKATAAWREVGQRHNMDWQVVRKRFLRMEEHGLRVRRMIERANRGLKRPN